MPPALTSPAADPNAAPRSADPLVTQLLALIGRAERPYYEVGVLLDREDFIAEQSYHRGRLARALACLFGHGTIAGLRVREPRDAADPTLPRRPNLEREIEIDPGLALDRLGRLIELRTAQCFRIRRWFDWVLENDADALDEALLGEAGAQEVRLDLFLQFVVCSHGATPAFASGPYDATDATVPSREHDAWELSWALRARAEADVRPQNTWLTPEALAAELDTLPSSGDAVADAAARATRRQELLTEAVLSAWEPLSPDARQPSLGPLLEQPLPAWWDRVLLARVHIPVRPAADGRPELDPSRELAIDNSLRPLVHVPGRWQGAVRL